MDVFFSVSFSFIEILVKLEDIFVMILQVKIKLKQEF